MGDLTVGIFPSAPAIGDANPFAEQRVKDVPSVPSMILADGNDEPAHTATRDVTAAMLDGLTAESSIGVKAFEQNGSSGVAPAYSLVAASIEEAQQLHAQQLAQTSTTAASPTATGDAMVNSWQQALQSLAGEEHGQAVGEGLKRNSTSLTTLAAELVGKGSGLHAQALKQLAAQYPQAQFRLVACDAQQARQAFGEHSSLVPGNLAPIVIEMTQGQTQSYFRLTNTPEAKAVSADSKGCLQPLAARDVWRSSIVAVDATHLAQGRARPDTLQSTLSIDAAGGLGAMERFEREHLLALARPTFQAFADIRGDAPRQFTNACELEAAVAGAMHIAPDNIPTTEEEQAQLEAGKWPLYTEAALKQMAPITEAIHKVAKENIAMSVLPLTFYSEKSGMVELPLFRVKGDDGRDYLIDNTSRRYDGLEDWRDNNRLPPGEVVYPVDDMKNPSRMMLRADAMGIPTTMREATHAVVDTVGEHIGQALDYAALVGGFAVGGAIFMGTGGIAVPIASALLMGYGATKSSMGLVDMTQHGESLNPRENSQAAQEWLNAGANAIGLATLGISSAATLAEGTWYATAAQRAVGGALIADAAIDTLMAGKNTWDLAVNWDNGQYTPEQKLFMLGQLAFWGTRGVQAFQRIAAARAARQIPPRSTELQDHPVVREMRINALRRPMQGHPSRPAKIDVITADLLNELPPNQVVRIRFAHTEAAPEGRDLVTTSDLALIMAEDHNTTRVSIMAINPNRSIAVSPEMAAKFTNNWLARMPISEATERMVLPAVVEFSSGKTARYFGNREMLLQLAGDRNVRLIHDGMAPGWLPAVRQVPVTQRGAGFNEEIRLRRLLPPSSIAHVRTTDIAGMKIYHGTLDTMARSVRQRGPENTGWGFGGRGLYAAVSGQRLVAERFAIEAAYQAGYNTPRGQPKPQPVVLTGTVNPLGNLRVGKFTVSSSDADFDLSKGILPQSWHLDPSLRRLLEADFDILDLRGMKANGVSDYADRMLIFHERAGKDAIRWDY